MHVCCLILLLCVLGLRYKYSHVVHGVRCVHGLHPSQSQHHCLSVRQM